MAEAYVAAGSNLRPASALHFARRELEARFGPLRVSPVYRSPDVTGAGADYLNAVFELRTGVAAPALRGLLREVEQAAGRRRDRPGECALDLDLLLQRGPAGVSLPHGDLRTRADLLAAMAALAPTLAVPGDGRTLAQRHAACRRGGQCRCLGELAQLAED